eukprot:CAMPEP_0194132228 /NCGR_PEP_ID=MMETSP0152-20130528/2745_1 /TAXON_ID=1049557 /ORGANISM="Thalassiothrix antarctica, Strain L6-D1" /LENGTH=554 /DNA_ID=CAMNT_0038827201 /DNA_START=39 /DNA_END=1706 /DNA_ORIENTATION=+
MRRSKLKKNHKSPLVETNDLVEEKGKKSEKKRKRSKQNFESNLGDIDAEERRLTASLFGDGVGDDNDDEKKTIQKNNQILVSAKEDNNVSVNHNEIIIYNSGSEAIFELDTQGEEFQDEDDFDANNESVSDRTGEKLVEVRKEREKPAWVDHDDVEVDLTKTNRLKKLQNFCDEDVSKVSGSDLEHRLRTRFQETSMKFVCTDWANMRDEKHNHDNIETSASTISATSTNLLPSEVLAVRRCSNANQQDFIKAALRSVHFHHGSDPDSPLLLTAGMDKTLRFFSVGEEESQKIHGITFPKLPITTARFLGDSGKVAISGKRSFFYIYDAIEGKLDLVPRIVGREEKTLERFVASPDGKTIAFLGNDGYIIFVDVKSKQWMFDLKINGSVRSVTFSPDSEYLFAGGSDGDIYQYDLRRRRCVERLQTDDGTMLTSFSASTRNLAVGSESGVVNFYSNYHGQKDRYLLKSIMNLQTTVDNSLFNHDGQILAFSSESERNSMKLLHTRTGTVFSNWPTSKTPLRHVVSLDFSPLSKFIAIGNNKGECLLYKLLHYHS